MTTASDYKLLKEIHDAVARVEDKVDNRFVGYDERLNKVESKLDNLLGKAALGMLVFMSVFGTAVALLVEWVKGKFK
jgi:hypothetical protein